MNPSHTNIRTLLATLLGVQGGISLLGVLLTLAYLYEALVIDPLYTPVAFAHKLCSATVEPWRCYDFSAVNS